MFVYKKMLYIRGFSILEAKMNKKILVYKNVVDWWLFINLNACNLINNFHVSSFRHLKIFYEYIN